MVAREPPPVGRCAWCGGPLAWSRVQYVPERQSSSGIVEARWVGSEPRCANTALGHDHVRGPLPAAQGPDHPATGRSAPVGGRGTGDRPAPAAVEEAGFDRWEPLLRRPSPLTWQERAMRLWPFGALVALAFSLSLIPPHPTNEVGYLLGALGCFVLAGSLIVAVPKERVPFGSGLVVVAVFCVGVGLLRASGGGGSAGYGPLLLLPMVWEALYGKRIELAVTVAAAAATMIVPIVAVGAPQYPPTQWRGVVLLMLIGGAVAAVVQRLTHENAQMVGRFETLANIDALTGLPNRRAWDGLADAVLAAVDAGAAPTIVLIDLDHFKAYNDKLGHVEADLTLRRLADRWSSLLRADDLLSRWGGEEFALLLPATGAAEATALVAGLAAATPGLTFSAGMLAIQAPISLDHAMAAADELLYRAKSSGRASLARASTPSTRVEVPLADLQPTIEALFDAAELSPPTRLHRHA